MKLLVVRCLLALGSNVAGTITSPHSAQVQLSADELLRQYKALTFITRLQRLNVSMTVRGNLFLHG